MALVAAMDIVVVAAGIVVAAIANDGCSDCLCSFGGGMRSRGRKLRLCACVGMALRIGPAASALAVVAAVQSQRRRI